MNRNYQNQEIFPYNKEENKSKIQIENVQNLNFFKQGNEENLDKDRLLTKQNTKQLNYQASNPWKLSETKLNPLDTEIIQEKVIKMNGEVRIVNYSKGKFIGKGGFAKCYEFTNLETKHLSAGKVIMKSSLTKRRATQKLISEIKIHKSIHNPHIVNFEHYFEDADNVYILLEICENQSLNELLKRRKKLTELEALYYCMQVIQALRYLHSHKIIHRDLKLGNLFLTDSMTLKVGDFGLATRLDFEGEKRRTVCGTPNYIAPEILEGKTGHSFEVDIWALGVILYTLIIGKPPFETSDVKQTYKKIKLIDYNFPTGAIISQSAKDLIQEILVYDPNQRPSLPQILDSDFFNLGTSIPKYLPSSTLACPPSLGYIRNYWPDADASGIVTKPISRTRDTNMLFPGNYEKETIEGKKICVKTTPNEIEGEIYIVDSSTSDIVIKKWIDYSSKYGIGYILSNNSFGVYFNDSSKIILDTKCNIFHYLERRSNDKIEIMQIYQLDNYPDYLTKKVTLFSYFRQILSNEIKSNCKEETNSELILKENNFIQKDTNNKDIHTNFVYLKKWMRTKHAILFRLSNKLIQVIFQDNTQIILGSEKREITYIDKNNDKETLPLNMAIQSNNLQLVKRLKYTKNILNNILDLNQKNKRDQENLETEENNKENNPNIINFDNLKISNN